jgi:hypothetical protein
MTRAFIAWAMLEPSLRQSVKPRGYWTVRRRSPLWLFHFERLTSHLSLFTFHHSPPPLTLRRANACSVAGLSLLTSHGRASGLAVRLQDLFLILSQGVDLGLFAVTAAFRIARDLKKIGSSGFEMIRIRISQCESPRVFRVYDKEMTNWRSN